MSVEKTGVLKRQAADALRRARKLPIGPGRNDLRQLALALRNLDIRGITPSSDVVVAVDAASKLSLIRPGA